MEEDTSKVQKFIIDEMGGMDKFLSIAIRMFDEWIEMDPCDPPHTYIIQLKKDFQTTLDNYRVRYLDDGGKDTRFED